MNKVILLARLTKDVDLRYTPQGLAIAHISVAVNKNVKNADDKVMFIDCSAFGRGAELLGQYFKRGSRILIDGELEFQQWEKNGQKFSKHIVLINSFDFIDEKANSMPAPPAQNPSPAPAAQSQPVAPVQPELSFGDDLPF